MEVRRRVRACLILKHEASETRACEGAEEMFICRDVCVFNMYVCRCASVLGYGAQLAGEQLTFMFVAHPSDAKANMQRLSSQIEFDIHKVGTMLYCRWTSASPV